MSVRLALIGAGRWGQVFIRTLRGLDDVRLCALASTNADAHDWVDATCRVEKDWRRSVTASDIDGVIIATPPASHAEIAALAMQAGKAVLVEKPLALSVEDATRLCEIGDAENSLCMVDHTHLYHAAFRELSSRVKAGGADRMVIRSSAGNHGPFRHDVDVLWDWGPHDVAMCLSVVGDYPTRVNAGRVIGATADGEEGESWSIELGFSQNRSAEIEISNLRGERCRWFSVEMDGDTYCYDDTAPTKLRYRPAGDTEDQPIETDRTPPVTRLIQEFAASIAAGSRNRNDLQLAADVVRVLAACEAAVGQAC